MRHNNIRDFEASLLREICKDVKIEPMLLPVGETTTLLLLLLILFNYVLDKINYICNNQKIN